MGINMWSRVAVLIVSLSASCHAGLLGAGTGEGSCPAAPFRANAAAIKWTLGCPAGAECCTEYGYCRSQAEWAAGAFRSTVSAMADLLLLMLSLLRMRLLHTVTLPLLV